ncbi:protein TIME FOR COFFEE [Sesamum alatum]|uniref:Protein TIME FOR COFFEE n=1 Tax=Sesamum alatum TaxID=300844 RepID=A0AAE2CDK8_9LAMI|nr:protein TIME FOR COFFEE [Sesamum alatum]
MERNRDLRRATISTVNGLPRRRQRITTLRDSTDEYRQMELQETARLRDRERLQRKDRDREFPKRRRVDRSAVQQRSGGGGESFRENESTDSSDEEYYEEEEETSIHRQNRMSQVSPTNSTLSNNRRGLRTLRSSPVLRAAADEILGVPVPRRARSASAKRLHEYWNSGSGGFGEDSSHRRFSPSPATVSLIGSGGASSSSSGASMKKKMKCLEPRTRVLMSASNSKPSSVIQDDIEIEVAEALFDLMKQSQSQSQSSPDEERVDRDGTNTSDDELKRLKADGGKDENNAFSFQNEQSIKVNAETNMVDSTKLLKKEGRIEKEKFPDDPAQELVSGDGFVNKGNVGSPKESKSPSCVKVNACDIQDPTVTKADHPANEVEDKKEAKLEIDLMAPPPLPSSPERVASVDIVIGAKVMTRDVQKKSETTSKNGPSEIAIRIQEGNNQLPNSEVGELEKRRPDVFSVSDCTTPQQQDRKEQKNQSTSSLLPFPVGMSSWPGVLPHPGYMSPLQAVLQKDGSARSSRTTELPPFKLSQPRTKRCATHQCLAHNIYSHQQLMKKTLSSGPTGPSTLYGTKPVNLKSMLPTQKLIPGNLLFGDFQGGQNMVTISGGSGKDKSSDAVAALNATSGKSLLQQASHQAPANNFMHGPGFIFPLGHHQTTMMAPANSSGPPQSASAVGHASLSSNSAGRPSVNLPLPGGAAAVSFNHPLFPSNEAAPYIALLQNNGCPVPISTNFAMPPFKGGSPTMPFLNSSFYSSPVFNVQNQQQLSLPHAPVQSASQNASTFSGSSSHKQPQGEQQTSTKTRDGKFPTPVNAHPPQPEKLLQPPHSSKSDTEISRKSASIADGMASHSVKPNNGQTSSFPVQPMNFGVIPPVSIGGGAVGNKHGDPRQGSKGGVELIPQALGLSFGSNPSINPALNFSSMVQNSAIFHMLPDMARNGNQMAPASSQMAQQKHFQASEGKYPFVGAAVTSGVSVTIPNFQPHQHQQQLVQLQKHHHMQLTGAGQVKASAPNSIPGSFLAGSFPSNNPVFTQVSVQTDNSSFTPMWENFSRTTAPDGSSQSASSSLVHMPQMKSSHGQTHISFGDSSVPAASFQGQQLVIKSQPVPSFVVGSPQNSSMSKNTGSSLRTASALGKAASTISALPSQETEASLNGPGQKTSPACRRNVPSILSTCPSQLPELKY